MQEVREDLTCVRGIADLTCAGGIADLTRAGGIADLKCAGGQGRFNVCTSLEQI